MSRIIKPDNEKYGRVLALQTSFNTIYVTLLQLCNLIKTEHIKAKINKEIGFITDDQILTLMEYKKIQTCINLLTEVAQHLSTIKA